MIMIMTRVVVVTEVVVIVVVEMKVLVVMAVVLMVVVVVEASLKKSWMSNEFHQRAKDGFRNWLIERPKPTQ